MHLVDVLSKDPELWHAWHLVQMLYGIYQADSEDEAAEKVKEFVHKWSRAGAARVQGRAQAASEVVARGSCLPPREPHHQWSA